MRGGYVVSMASKTMNKHRLRLVSIGFVAALAVTTFAHLSATGGASYGGNDGVEADASGGQYWLQPYTSAGDILEMNWESVGGAFRPVFTNAEFYVVADLQGDFDPDSSNIVFHATDDDPNRCCSAPSFQIKHESSVTRYTMLWVMDYAPGWAPIGAETTPGILGGGSTDTTAQERELTYIRAFMTAAADHDRRGGYQNLATTSADNLALHTPFIVAESLLVLAAVGTYGASLARPESPDADGVLGIVQKGIRHLRAQVRLHVALGPLILIAGAFGAEAMDNGGFGIHDPAGIAGEWTVFMMIGLWLLAVVLWVVGLVRVLRALRHYNQTQEPDLGELGA